ncbi:MULTISPECIES: 50S ribosomal protein L29 [Companilactobacillus]|uniref:Large ribosomal subunit protein uL29 n=2 Tax=Companilactobacillus TaxID=2767879 RepID=A0A5P0ZHF4_9LACO|nr:MULTISPECIES: 50S ribosomal protein L29 [Companilactobacillus]AKP67032.1 50S ribosomal protein L29 [Companilactobacillus ginsenosidimutans]MQS44906.1 50S ribosomal protein L29 [Companilactobacillus mishanensis]MQS52415.1 50S ribosomal protein L29 [Companilactobacillus mishanensis]MQS89421.1 50S ribosomal protein L29 [Companilactobacillus mishanensis]
MKASEIKELTATELQDKVKQYKEELFNLRFQQATGQLENTARLKAVRKNIARLRTVQNQVNNEK